MTLSTIQFDLNNPLHVALAYANRCDPASWGGQPQDGDQSREEYMAFLQRRHGEDPRNLAFVTENGEIVGQYEIGARLPESDVGYINFLFVRFDLRGKGYGKRVLDLACTALRDRGYTTVKLSSIIGYEYNTRFYTACGFMNLGQRAERPRCYIWEKKFA